MISNERSRTCGARVGRLMKSGASATALCFAGIALPAAAQTAGAPVDPGASTGAGQSAYPGRPDAQGQSGRPGQPTPTGEQAGAGTAGEATSAPISDSNAATAAGPGAAPGAGDAGQVGANDVVVTGIRQSLANAQAIKRNSDTVVDAITATDIGALPDRSVTEALQRVPGVSIQRFAANNDPDHFSVEGSGVTVRGLNFVRSEFNGRDAFAAGVGGQALNFADVPAELLGSVEVFKNTTAQNIEGGLAGTVNLNTRKPFDNPGFHIGYDGEANYGDFEKKWSPTGSVLISDTWNTGIGRIGLLADVSYSEIRSRADGVQVTNFQTRDGRYALAANTSSTYVCRNYLPSSVDTLTTPAAGAACGATGTPGADGKADTLPVAYSPLGGQFRTQDFDRKRDGIAFAAQWESNDGKATLTEQFLRSHTTNAWGEHTFETSPDLAEYNTYPAGCQQNGDGAGAFPAGSNPLSTTIAECNLNSAGQFQFAPGAQGGGITNTTSYPNFAYNGNGLFQSGLITQPGTGYRGACSGSVTCEVPTGGQQQTLVDRQVHESNTVYDAGTNLKIKFNDHFSMNLDVDYTHAEHDNTDFTIAGSTFADEGVNITGALPAVTPVKPLTLSASWATPNPTLVGETNQQYFHDQNVQFWRYAMDHIEHSVGSEYAIKDDLQYNFDSGFLRDVRLGARYADRSEKVEYSAYNWGALSEIWSGTNPVSIAQSPANASFFTFPNFFRGATPGPIGGYYYNGDLINGYNQAAQYFQSIGNTWTTTNAANSLGQPVSACNASTVSVNPTTGVRTLGCTPTTTWTPLAGRPGVVPGTPFLPSEIQPVTDETVDVYGQLDFGRNDPIFGDVRLSGNVGLRFTSDQITSGGSIGAPSAQALGIAGTRNCTPQVPPNAPPGTSASVPGICGLSDAAFAGLQTFANGLTTPQVARQHYNYLLPSVNLKFGLSRDLVFRLAGSKVLTRPDLGDIRNFVTFGLDQISGNLTAMAGNPYLKPATAWQFDATLEWYFARVGSLTVDGFYKSIHDFFYSSLVNRQIANGGVTETAIVRAPANYDGYGKIKGAEVAYQQSFDFLPGFLKGLGTNLNYTFIESSGLPNSFLNGGTIANTSTIAPKGNLPLEGLSKHNFNAELFYERGFLSLRAAYNWRSRYLLTASDTIFPYYSIFQGAGGQLDASAFINVNKYLKLGVQGVNLNNQVTKTYQAYTGDPNQLAPRSYFVNDRRFSFIVRGNF